ncbi:MAG: efflux RND transporter permease subunit, partial [Gammaproteobacteria bacterium]|nr:efflux RND transporter permease subunit [Gammaproteobacteria bacterium]
MARGCGCRVQRLGRTFPVNRVISWFATNHVAANLVMALAILAGLVSIVRIPFKLVPDMDVPIVTVSVPYLGAAPAEVESGVCARLE